jgi:FMN reductase [NAD(P)H]
VDTSSPDAEGGQAFRLFVEDVYAIDLSSSRAAACERHQTLDRLLVSFENRLDGPIPPVGDPAVDAALLRHSPGGVPEEHALHPTVDDDAAANHATYSRVIEFKDILKRRRMVRAYELEPVPRDTLERIAGTIRRAPSAGFSQGQRLLVITEPQRRRSLAEAAAEEFYVEQGFAPWISSAAALIVVCTREDDYHDRYRQPDKTVDGAEIEWPVPYWHTDAGAAAMLILLAAVDEGLAAGVFGIPSGRMQRVRELLELPDDVAIVEVITLGYPAQDSASDRLSSRGTRPRKPIDELVRWESWN